MNRTTTSLRWRTTATTTVGGFLAGTILLIAAPSGVAGAEYDPYAPTDPCADIATVMANGGYGCETPSTEPPTTQPPTTEPPATQPPTTEPPTTQPPTTQPPTTQPPTTQPPVTIPPKPGTGEVTASASCVDDTTNLTMTLANTGGELPVAFAVTHPVTGIVTTATVTVGSSTQVVLASLPSGSVHVAITADGAALGRTFQVPVCLASQPPATPIISSTESPVPAAAPAAPALPATGNDRIELVTAIAALVVLSAGVWLVRISNRRRLQRLG